MIYRPPPNSKNKFSVNKFIEELTELLEYKSSLPEKLLISGDFNFHLTADCSDTKAFCDVLRSFDLDQHVTLPTHSKGHVLDLLITKSCDSLVSNVAVLDTGISDHSWVHCKLNGPKPHTVKKNITYRKIKSIDTDKFAADIKDSDLYSSKFNHVNDYVSTYNSVLKLTLDKHAPSISKTVTVHPNAPWYDEDIDLAKKERRLAEKRW